MALPDSAERGLPADASDVPDLLACVLAAQQRRAEQFGAFRRGFDSLLASNDLGAYNVLCSRVAAQLNEISTEVNSTAVALKAAGRQDLFDSIAALQTHEKETLRLEATLQVLRKEHAAGRWSWQRSESIEGIPAGELRPSWANACRAHVVQGEELAPADGCSCNLAEPTEAEYASAVREATQAMQVTAVAINEVLSELAEAAAELREE